MRAPRILRWWLLGAVLVACGCRSESTAARISITPQADEVALRTSLAFQATVDGTFSDEVIWSLTGPGTLSSSGLYVAPSGLPRPEENDVRVRATSVSSGASTEVALRVVFPPLDPPRGPTRGGTRVTIVGQGFAQGTTAVAFGGQPAVVEVVSSTQLYAQTPSASGIGPVDVEVTTEGSVSHFPLAFTYGATNLRFSGMWLSTVCGSAVSIDTGEVDGDGRSDLVVACVSPPSIEMRPGDGRGGYLDPIRFFLPTGRTPQQVRILEPGGDVLVRERDVSSVSYVRRVRWDGTGLVQAPPDPPPAVNATAAGAADLNADGFADVVVFGPVSGVIFYGPGAVVSALLPAGPAGTITNVAVADFGGDGDLDLWTTTNTETGVYVFDSGTGLYAYSMLSGESGTELAIADVDGDGLVDALLGGRADDFAVLHASSSFGIAQLLPISGGGVTSASQVTAGDFDGNGTVELLGVERVSTIPTTSHFLRFEGATALPEFFAGATSILDLRTIPGAESAAFLALGSFGLLEGGTAYGTTAFPASLWKPVFGSMVDGAGSVAVLEGDTLTASARFERFAMGSTSQSLQMWADVPLPEVPSSLNLRHGDVDGDLVEEGLVAWAGTAGGGVIALDAVTGSPTTLLDGGKQVLDVGSRDLDGDGLADLITVECDPGLPENALVRVRWADGIAAYLTPVDLPTQTQPTNLILDDADGDGRADIVAWSRTTPLLVIFPVVARDIGSATILDLGGIFRGVEIRDLNSDFLPDLLAASATRFLVARNDGGLAFASAKLDFAFIQQSSLLVADFDADGATDAIIAGSNGIQVFRGNGDATFAPEQLRALAGFDTGRSVLADVDGDGLPDLVPVGMGAGGLDVAVIRNLSR